MSEYLLVLLICLCGPLVLSFIPRLKLQGYFKTFLTTITTSAIPFILWDFYATWRGHWGFNPQFILGPKLINLPLEEIAFFFVIPFCCMFVWILIRNFPGKKEFWDFSKPYSPKDL
jgi:lycopene cyclase domain-containing protein